MAKSKRVLKQNKQPQWQMFYLLPVMVIGYFMIAHYNRGLFYGYQVTFEAPVYWSVFFSSLLLIATSWWMFSRNKLSIHQLVSFLLVWLIVLAYVISWFNAVSKHTATDMIMIAIGWASFFMAAYVFYQKKNESDFLVHGILCGGYIIVVIGLLGWFGQLGFEDILLEGRLAGVFQYPNTLAILLLGILLSQLYLISVEQKKAWQYLHTIMMVPVIVSFLLTLSRGAMAVLAIMFILHLMLIRGEKQPAFILHALSGFVWSLAAFYLLYAMQDSKAIGVVGWLILMALSAGNFLLVKGIDLFLLNCTPMKRLASFASSKKYVLPLLIIVMVGLGAFVVLSQSPILNILPDALENRIKTISLSDHSFSQRLTYYQDSWEVAKDHPVFGAGGGAWSWLYRQYQSYPYIGNQSHSFAMQLLNEIGWFGLGLFLLLLIWAYAIHVKAQRQSGYQSKRQVFFLVVTPILLHSLLDFHLSYVYIASLVFFCLGAMASQTSVQIGKQSLDGKTKVPGHVPAAVVLILAIFTVFTAGKYAKAADDYITSIDRWDYKKLVSAMEARPYHPDYIVMQTNVLIDEYKKTGNDIYLQEAEMLVDRLREREIYHLSLTLQKVQILELQDAHEEAVLLLENMTQQMPWFQLLNEQLMMQYHKMGFQDEFWWHKALDKYEELQDAIRHFKEEGLYRARFFHTNNIDPIVEHIRSQLTLDE